MVYGLLGKMLRSLFQMFRKRKSESKLILSHCRSACQTLRAKQTCMIGQDQLKRRNCLCRLQIMRGKQIKPIVWECKSILGLCIYCIYTSSTSLSSKRVQLMLFNIPPSWSIYHICIICTKPITYHLMTSERFTENICYIYRQGRRQ